MTRFVGKDGVVEVGGTAIAEVRSWELQIQGPVAEAPAMGRDWAGHGVGAERVTGTVTCWYDPDDAGQTAMKFGDEVGLTLQPQGAGSGLPQFNLSAAVVTGEPRTADRDAFAEATFNFAANSALDRTPQA